MTKTDEALKIMQDYFELERRVKIMEMQINSACQNLHNIREHCIAYTPIAESITDTLRVLKGRKND